MTTDKAPDLASVLRAEANAIAAAADRLDAKDVEKAVSLLAGCESKVVFTGVGKSGIVAQKCAATFTSVGLVAVFLNPLDALHGDLGIVRDGVLIGMGAIVLNGAVVGEGSLVAAGAVIPQGMVVPPATLVAGVPGRVRRELTDAEVAQNRHNAAVYEQLIGLHRDAEQG